LPPVDTITAQTDVRAFLAPGVPPELTRAALRRAWAADPKIRDFVGLAEYDWDFNAPDAVTGFGPLELTEEMRRRMIDMVGRGLAPEPRREVAPSKPICQSAPSNAESPAAEALSAPDRASAAPAAQGQPQIGSAQPKPTGSERCESSLSGQGGTAAAAAQDSSTKSANTVIVKRLHGRALPR
jgi:hypothetical protein